MDYKRESRNLVIGIIICVIIGLFLVFYTPNERYQSFFDKSQAMLFMLAPILAAFWLYIENQREKERQKIKKENNNISIALKEIEKNNQWCNEYITQGVQPSIKFYNLTDIGIKRCLNTLKFEDDKVFLEAFYMSLKLIGIVNNIIQANIINVRQNFNSNLVSMARESIHEADKLKIYLQQRINKNKELIKNI